MLGKLMKHEFRAAGRILLPIYLLLLLTTLLFNITLRLTTQYDESVALTILMRVTEISFIIALIGTAVMSFALMIWRFYKNLMTDEGYLMFTLPTNTDTILWSKLLTAVIWSFITFVVYAIVIAITLVIQDMDGVQAFFHELVPFWNSLDITVGEAIGYGAEIFAMLLLSAFASFLMFYAAISLGHSFSNHKILLSVVFYIAFNVGLQIITTTVSVFGAITLIPDDLFIEGENLGLSMHLLMLFGIGISLIESIGFYILTHFMLKKRLNLQ